MEKCTKKSVNNKKFRERIAVSLKVLILEFGYKFNPNEFSGNQSLVYPKWHSLFFKCRLNFLDGGNKSNRITCEQLHEFKDHWGTHPKIRKTLNVRSCGPM